MKSRREFLIVGGAGLWGLVTPLASFAQRKPVKVYRIGVLFVGSAAVTAHLNEALQQGLGEHGYVEGQNVIVERRYGDGKVERLPDLAAELVRIKPDVIVATTDPGIAAVKQETQTRRRSWCARIG